LETFDVSLATKLAFGGNAEQVHIDGFQFLTLPNGTVVPSQGGLLALPSNIGRTHHSEFSFVPEFDITVSYALCRHVIFKAGYDYLYWTNVVRPGDQIDRVIDVTQIPNFPAVGATPTGIARPAVPVKQSDFWAQGLVLGLQFVW
jgi:Putative beta barrel porin-7 (BBP7)